MSRAPLAPLAAVALFACAGLPPIEDSREDVYEAVFRYQFEHNGSKTGAAAAGYFLSIDGADPSAAFLARFAGNAPPVHGASEFDEGDGIAFRVAGYDVLGPDGVEVPGGYYEDPHTGSGNLYRVVRDGAGWRVEADQRLWGT